MTPPASPSLGTLLKTFRATQHASVRETAMRLGLSVDRLRALENDAALPVIAELPPLCDGLGLWPQRVLRAVRQTALDMLWDASAVAADRHPRALAARQLPPRETPPPDGLATLPDPLRRALARALQVDPSQAAALGDAWQALQGRPSEAQRIVYDAAVSRLTLEGEPEPGMVAAAPLAPPELLAWCEADRAHLLGVLDGRRAGRGVPADAIDAVIEDVLYFGLIEKPLPGAHLGWCDYDRRSIVINGRMAAIALPNTNLDALRSSTKAHEVGHIRLPGHEAALRARHAQTGGRAKAVLESPEEAQAEAQREWEADFYAGVFLVPSAALRATPEAAFLARCHARGEVLSSDALWEVAVAAGRRFRVTGSLMAHRLSHAGLLVKHGRELSLPAA